MTGAAVRWRGVRVDPRTAAMMDELARLCDADGIALHPSQGSWSGAAASAGTHTGCGAVDLTGNTAAQCARIVAHARRVGFAAWHRTPQQADWPRHCHLIAVQPGGPDDPGCLAPSAHRQVRDLFAGRNGLASGAPDDGPRTHVGATWETYTAQRTTDPGRAPDMILITRKSNGRVYLVAITGPVYITDPDDLKEIRRALKDPGHTAGVKEGTWARLAKYAADGAL